MNTNPINTIIYNPKPSHLSLPSSYPTSPLSLSLRAAPPPPRGPPLSSLGREQGRAPLLFLSSISLSLYSTSLSLSFSLEPAARKGHAGPRLATTHGYKLRRTTIGQVGFFLKKEKKVDIQEPVSIVLEIRRSQGALHN